MDAGGSKLVTTNEPTVIAKLLLDTIVMEDSQRDGCLANPACTNQSDGPHAFCKTNDLLDKLIASKKVPRRWRW